MRWKRVQIQGPVRLGIIVALALLVLVPAYLAYRAFQDPTTKVYRVPVWGWVHWGEWDYSVFLKPNSIYGTQELGPGLVYFENLVQGVEARFSYNFATDTPARIEGWYQVTADLVAGELLRERTLIVPRTPFDVGDGSSVNVTFAVPVDREAHRARVTKLADETGVQADEAPTVTYTAHVEAEAFTETGKIRQVLETTLVVPLTGETFTLGGDRSQMRNGVVRRDEERPVPGVSSRRRYMLVATGLVALLAPLFALVTAAGPRRGPSPEDALAREARRIRRKYRKRISEARLGASRLPGREVVPVASMEDLARVSEELLKPVIYCALADHGEMHVFYIVDGATRYQFELAGSSG